MTGADDASLEIALSAVLRRSTKLLSDAPVSGGVLAIRAGESSRIVPFGAAGPLGLPLRGDERFEIGSISKTAVGLLAAKMHVGGQIELDTPVRQILPWLPLPREAGEPTLIHLLTHTSGWIAGSDALPGDRAQALAIGETRAASAPGEYFHYSNVGYIVLGLALEQTLSISLDAALAAEIFSPLGMAGASGQITGAQRATLCRGTVPLRDDAPWQAADGVAEAAWLEPAGADGNVAATAADLLAFATALTTPNRVIRAPWLVDAVQFMSAGGAPGGEGVLAVGPHLPATQDRYGLGVNVEDTLSGRVLTHGGGMVGFGAFMISHSDEDLSIGVLVSGPGERPYAELLARELHARLLAERGKPVGEGEADPIAALMPVRRPLEGSPLAHAGIPGCYRSYSPWAPHLVIGLGDDGLLTLRAYSGVEAPTADMQLVPMPAEGVFRYRIGADARLPERVTFSGFIDGVAQWLNRDGCQYARVVDRSL